VVTGFSASVPLRFYRVAPGGATAESRAGPPRRFRKTLPL